MTELIERYVHQVGHYLPPKERAEIEAELRSQIQDQLDDRYGTSPSQEEVASVLTELGHPYQMATFYSSDQYLVGPELYPFMMMVLRYGWLLVPSIMLFLHLFGVLISPQQRTIINLVIEPLLAALQATFIFSAVVVLIFAIIQRSKPELDENVADFNPLELSEVDDPGTVDRAEGAIGVAIGTFVTLVFVYFLRVGGLTLRFNLSDPGNVIAMPTSWAILLIITTIAMIVVHLWLMKRNRWNVGLWLFQTVLEIFGVFCLYFVVYEPVYTHIALTVTAIANVPLPEILATLSAVGTLINRGIRLVKLWNYPGNRPIPFTMQTNG